MALQAKKYKEDTTYLRVIKNENRKSTIPMVTIGFVFFVVLAFAVVFVVKNSNNGETLSKIVTNSKIDWNNPPCSPNELNGDWIEVTPEIMGQNSNRREFQNKNTGLKIAFDKGIPGKPKFQGKDHWHIYNPLSSGVMDYYIDKNGNEIHKNNDNSHIKINCK